MSRAARTPPRAFLPQRAVENWNALLDELRLCLRDDNRSRTRFNDLYLAIQQRDCAWPTRSDSDQWLLSGFLRLVMAFATGGPSRRPWLGDQLGLLLEAVEGMVDDHTSEAQAVTVIPTTVTAPPKAPEPGEPGYRRDIHE